MLTNVLPGLRELRAPLAAGYLWLLFTWMVWGDELPGKTAEKADPLDRLYRLEPVVTGIGLAVVASVAAYLVGSIVIDVQASIGGRIAALARALQYRSMRKKAEGFLDRAEFVDALVRRLAVTEAGGKMLEPWIQARADELKEEFDAQREAAMRSMADLEDEARTETGGVVRAPEYQAYRYLAKALSYPASHVERAAQGYIASNRDLLKTRLLDASEPLHSELDRPDAEATFRMALWPPLAALVIYLSLEASALWAFAIVVPGLLAWQWLSLRRQANAALVAAFVARDELGGEVAQTEVRKATIRIIVADVRNYHTLNYAGYERLRDLEDYAEKPTRPPKRGPRPGPHELHVPGDGGTRAPGGEPKEPDKPARPPEAQEAPAEASPDRRA